ncbi:MAG: SufD family Fe-S cluster assembly protein [Spirochaetales bacterium]|nr:SufD family Fe-S cluster assembly protein [Spirochaetales bacterium]
MDEFKNFDYSDVINKKYKFLLGGDLDVDDYKDFYNINVFNGVPDYNNEYDFLKLEYVDDIPFTSLIPLNDEFYNLRLMQYNFEIILQPDKPIVIKNYYTGSGVAIASDFNIQCKNNIKADLLELNISSADKLIVNNRNFSIEESFLNYSRMDFIDNETSIFNNYNVSVGVGKFESVLTDKQGKVSINFWDINLNKPDSTAEVSGIVELNSADRHGNVCKINHLKNETGSKQEFRHILNGTSYAMYDGDSHIAVGAQDSSSSQISKAIMLSNNSRILNKPRLNIHNSNVKATHGATVGKLNNDDIFYMKQRGLSTKLVEEILLEAFKKDILDRIHNQEIRSFFHDKG